MAESQASIDVLLRGSHACRDLDWSFTEGNGILDLSPGQRAYIHRPNDSVNFWLNLSLLVAVTYVLGLGFGSYMGSLVNWADRVPVDSRHAVRMQHLQQQLDDCILDREILLNSTLLTLRPPVMGPEPLMPRTTLVSTEPSSSRSDDPGKRINQVVVETIARHTSIPPADQQEGSKVQIAEGDTRVENRPANTRTSCFRDPSFDLSLTRHIPVAGVASPAKTSLTTNWQSVRTRVAPAYAEANVVIETSTSISLRRPKSGKGGYKALVDDEADLKVLLLLSSRGASRPVFLESGDDHRRGIASTLNAFLAETFPDGKYFLWTESSDQRRLSPVTWKGRNVVPLEDNAYAGLLRKTSKYFWSNLKKKLFKGWKGASVSILRSRVSNVLSSLPESHFQSMFQMLKHKMQRIDAKTSSRDAVVSRTDKT